MKAVIFPNCRTLVIETAPDGNAVTPSGRRASAAPDEKATISKIMHDIALKYAKDYNFRHDRTGHFWGGRFKSPVVETDSHGLNLIRYISQNPVRAGMTKTPDEYAFCSFDVYKKGEPDGLVDLLPTFEGLASTRKRAAEMFSEYCVT